MGSQPAYKQYHIIDAPELPANGYRLQKAISNHRMLIMSIGFFIGGIFAFGAVLLFMQKVLKKYPDDIIHHSQNMAIEDINALLFYGGVLWYIPFCFLLGAITAVYGSRKRIRKRRPYHTWAVVNGVIFLVTIVGLVIFDSYKYYLGL